MNAAGIFTVAVLVLTTAACDEDRGPTAPKPVAQSPDSITNIRVTVPPTRGLDANTVGIGLDAFPRAIATRVDGTAVDVTELATWQSSDAAIVKIERQRFPVGVTVGTALLSATYQAVTGTQVVTTRTCVSWELYGRPMLWLGQSVDFVAHAYDACLLSETYIRPLWSTLNPSVAVLEPSSDQPSRIKVVGRIREQQ